MVDNKIPSKINEQYRIKELKEILNDAIEKNISIHQSLKNKKRGKNFFNENFSLYADDELNALKKVYDGKKFVPSVSNSSNLNIDDKYDNRSTCGENRDENGKIVNYWYRILVRDEEPFTGIITRDQMDSIYQNYPYVTTNTCSTFFPYLTFVQFKRILRVFNITKEKLFPSFRIEEHTEEELAHFALKAKELSSYKKFVEQKPIFIEKQLRETQKELLELKENREWVEKIVDKYFSERSVEPKIFNDIKVKNDVDKKTLFVFFGDIHFGKCFKSASYNRGTDKFILRERVLQIANDTINEFNTGKYNDILLINTGDVLETITEGMHSNHQQEMDLLGEKQLSYAIDVLEEMLDTILKNVSGTLNLMNLPGNHDRIGITRSDDKKRTAGAIVFSILKKLYSKTSNDKINIENPEDGIISTEKDRISIVAHHGDATLSKRKPLEILNIWKKGDASNYSIIIQGHWHQFKVEEGSNYTSLGIGSVCSADNYIQNELGLGTQPSYVMGHRNDKYGFDFKKITLY